MVYSKVCEWLHDFVETSPPNELLDTWDFNRWIIDSEIDTMFQEFFLPLFKTKKSHDDATQIFNALKWEYFCFRKNEALSKYVPRENIIESLLQNRGDLNLKKLESTDFSDIVTNNTLRLKRLKQPLSSNSNVSLFRFRPVIHKIYEALYGKTVRSDLGSHNHDACTSLFSAVEALVSDGRLLQTRVGPVLDIIPDSDYYKMQIDMEICNIDAVDYIECNFKCGDRISSNNVPGFIGVIFTFGTPESWRYIYSPLFPDTENGRLLANKYSPYKTDSGSSSDNECEDCTVKLDLSGNADFFYCLKCSNPGSKILERINWQLDTWKISTVLRNPRWWTHVGLVEYRRFMSDLRAIHADPMFCRPMILDEDVFFKTA
jgi:hypothetical protein